MTEIRALQLEILDTVDAHCRQQGLTYFLAWGTLLGAVRHGGYIPWDDDIDIMMLREDYRQFLDSFRRTDIFPLAVGALSTDRRWPYPFAKVFDTRTRVYEETNQEDLPIGVNIDVFPIDGVAPSSRLARLHASELRVLRKLHLLKAVGYRPERRRWKTAAIRVTKPLVQGLSAGTLAGWFDRSAERYPTTAARVGVHVGPSDWSIPRSVLDPAGQISFEGREFSCPGDPDAVLREIYGDYMTPPPTDKQVSPHRFTAEWVVEAL